MAAARHWLGNPARRPGDSLGFPAAASRGPTATASRRPTASRRCPATATSRGPTAAVVTAAVATASGHPIGRGAAQRLARTELSKAIYHPGEPLTQRILGYIGRLLDHLFAVGNVAPGGWWALVALAAAVVIVIAVIMARIGPVARRHRDADPLLPGSRSDTAREHRSRASLLASAGDYSAAILECVRAIARQLEERGILAPRVGRTADEIADEAAKALPGDADALRAAVRLFDEVCYGQRQGTRDGYERLRALDARIAATSTRESRAAAPAAAGAGLP